MGQLFVISNGKELCRTHFLDCETWEIERKMQTANYEDTTFYEHHLNISGLENMDCHLKGNKTDILINQNGKLVKFCGCTVKDFGNDHYHLIYKNIGYRN